MQLDGHCFSTTSDVEVIVHMYESMGTDCFKHLQGIFAVILWDETNHQIVVARDRMGVKPLYYAEDSMWFMFASEMRALLVNPEVDRGFHPKGLTSLHAFRFVPHSDTIVNSVKKLSPGSYAVVRRGRMHRDYFWSAYDTVRKAPIKERASTMRKRMFDAVWSQAAPGVSSGTLLSGGLDSTAIVAIQHELFQESTTTFTVAFERPQGPSNKDEYDEISQARRVAQAYNATNIAECYSAEDVMAHLPQIIASMDEPIADPTAIPLWFACHLAKSAGVKVLYSGEGLDELFNGYDVYRQIHWLRVCRLLPRTVREFLLAQLKALRLPGAGVMRRSLLPCSVWYQGVGGVFTEQELNGLFAHLPYGQLDMQAPVNAARRITDPIMDRSVLTQMTYFDVLAWLPENTLVKSDKVAMAHSVELRVPFLDDGLVELALSLTDQEKLRGRKGKWMVRQVLAHVAPKWVLKRKKAGFPVPLTAWMFNEWKEFVMTTLLNPNANTRALYERESVERMFSAPQSVQPRAARMLWTLLTVELWMEHVLRARPISSASDSQKPVASMLV